MEENKVSNDSWALLSKFPRQEITKLVEGYLACIGKINYLRFIFLGRQRFCGCLIDLGSGFDKRGTEVEERSKPNLESLWF